MKKLHVMALAVVLTGWAGVGSAQVISSGSVTSYRVPAQSSAAQQIDFVHAQAMELPQTQQISSEDMARAMAPQFTGTPGVSAGFVGTDTNHLVSLFLGTPETPELVSPQEFGTYNHPFSTARADLRSAGVAVPTNTYYPYRASGKLFFNIGAGSYVCSASLIKPGVIVTAAHCVANYGQSQFYTNWQFVPGYRNGSAPFGVWTAAAVWVKTAYYNGSGAACAVYGVVCPHDVAIIVLNPQSAAYPGSTTGFYGYGWDGYGFVNAKTQITQIGYPVCLDSGLYMERNDSYGYTDPVYSNNTIIGSLMCGGSSGGPWLVNFGVRPTLTATTSGTAALSNIVVGVTSWGYVSTAPKEQGAAPFTSSNVVSLITSACTATPGAC